jgi:hypothetical protein
MNDKIKAFADELRNAEIGYRFIQGVPVRIATIGTVRSDIEPTRVYEVLGREYTDANDAADWAIN